MMIKCKNCNGKFELKGTRHIYCSEYCRRMYQWQKYHFGSLRRNIRISRDALIQKYLRDGRSMSDIAKDYNTSKSVIFKKLKKYNLSTRGHDANRENMIKAVNIKPNRQEIQLDKLIQTEFPNQFRLNVDGGTVINDKIPDWISCNGKKKVILFNGLYWHLEKIKRKNLINRIFYTKETEERKLNRSYAELGFEVLHIWEDELKNNREILNKINNFINKQIRCPNDKID